MHNFSIFYIFFLFNSLITNKGFTGDGLSCRPTSSCYNNQTICDDNASCILNSEGYYSCQCNEGYRGNGSMCKGDFI